MTKQPTSHFSLSDWRKAITEHEHPLWTLTTAEVESLVGRLEKAREFLTFYLAEMELELREIDEAETDEDASLNAHALRYAKSLSEWLAGLERAK